MHKLYRESGLYDTGLARDTTLKEFVSGLARLPLAHQPGEVFEYGLSADVLGRVIEVASGQPLDQFLDTRLFKPLDMVDTGFWVPPEKLARLIDPPAGARVVLIGTLPNRPRLFSGGGGLVSTAADYLRFCQMLLNGGELDGVAHPLARNRPTDDHERAAARDPFRRLARLWGRRAARPWARLRDPQRCRVEHGARIGWQLHLERASGAPISGSTRRSNWLPCS